MEFKRLTTSDALHLGVHLRRNKLWDWQYTKEYDRIEAYDIFGETHRFMKVQCICGERVFFGSYNNHLNRARHWNNLKEVIVRLLFLKKLPIELCNIIVDFMY